MLRFTRKSPSSASELIRVLPSRALQRLLLDVGQPSASARLRPAISWYWTLSPWWRHLAEGAAAVRGENRGGVGHLWPRRSALLFPLPASPSRRLQLGLGLVSFPQQVSRCRQMDSPSLHAL